MASVSVNLWWPPGTSDPTLNLRYLFVGKDNYSGGQPMQGPVWSNLVVTSVDCPGEELICGDKCPDEFCSDCPSGCGPCTGFCGDGACVGGETCAICPDDCGECPEAEAEWPQEREAGEEMPAAEEAGEEGTPEPGSDSDSGPVLNGAKGGCSCGLVH